VGQQAQLLLALPACLLTLFHSLDGCTASML
jgi:hypothetical protein